MFNVRLHLARVFFKFRPFCAAWLFLSAPAILCQQPPAPSNATLTLQNAIAGARRYGGQIDAANLAVALAREDTKQAKAAGLPSLNAFNQFIYTEGNGTPSGVFVANDGVHVYNEQAIVHQELFSLVRRGEIRRAAAAEATARARVDVAARGIVGTVIQNYYGIVSAQRKITSAQTSVAEAQRFFDITQAQEKGGEVAHADVIKAQLQLQQRQRDLQDTILAVERAKVTLSVLIFPDFQQEFSVVDDLENAPVLPPLAEAGAQAIAVNPDVRAAQLGVTEARLGVSVARYAFFPSFAFDFFYGINANQFAARTDYPTEPGNARLPNPVIPYRQNLGYSAQVTLNIPVWNWGATQSRVRQAVLRSRQASVDLALAQRTSRGNLALAYREAQGSQSQLESLKSSSALAAESLRLALLRYKAGEATSLEVVDAQTAAAQARVAYDDGLLRYRVAIATIQSLTGTL